MIKACMKLFGLLFRGSRNRQGGPGTSTSDTDNVPGGFPEIRRSANPITQKNGSGHLEWTKIKIFNAFPLGELAWPEKHLKLNLSLAHLAGSRHHFIMWTLSVDLEDAMKNAAKAFPTSASKWNPSVPRYPP